MASTTFEPNFTLLDGLRRARARITGRGLWLGLIMLAALAAFELFNFATTEYALETLFGLQNALGIATWATILAVAFCSIDFAGLSRLFTPETGRKEPKEIWLLTGAWLLGAGMNALMTWWAIGSALSANPILGNELLSRADILHYGSIFIAGLVFFTRILIVSTFAFAGDHLFSADRRAGQVGIVEGAARRYEPRPAHGSAPVPAYSRSAVTGPEARPGLPERVQPMTSSSYARNSDWGAAQRDYFGRGAGGEHSAIDHSAGRAELERFQPIAPAAQQPASPGRVETANNPFSRTSAAGAGSALPEPSAPSAAANPFSRPASAGGGRASTTRTVSPARAEAPALARAPSSGPAATAPAPASNELEYVELD